MAKSLLQSQQGFRLDIIGQGRTSRRREVCRTRIWTLFQHEARSHEDTQEFAASCRLFGNLETNEPTWQK
jgi:hypothetical protein